MHFSISVSRAYLVICKSAKPAKKWYEMRMCISWLCPFKSEDVLTTGEDSSKSNSKEKEVRSFALRVGRARGRKTKLPSFRKRCDTHHYHCSSLVFLSLFFFFGKAGVFTPVFLLRVIVFHVIMYVAMLYLNYLWCGDSAVWASFVRECTDVIYVAGEGMGLTVHKESVAVGSGAEISSCSIYFWQKLLIIELGNSHAVMNLVDSPWRS